MRGHGAGGNAGFSGRPGELEGCVKKLKVRVREQMMGLIIDREIHR